MSMNFSHTIRLVSACLTLTAGLAPLARAQAPQSAYYQTITVDSVLKSKPALVYVSPKYQVTIMVNGREVTGVSLELSKQKNFNVTLADNHHMIFLDTLTNKGGADLNLILDDEQVLPLHLMVRDVPSGTRIYTFETASETETADAPGTQTVVAAPSDPALSTPATSSAGQVQPDRPISTLPLSGPVPRNAPAAAQMKVSTVTSGKDSIVTVQLVSPALQAIRADLKNLRLSDGDKALPYTLVQGQRGRLLPLEVKVRVSNLPKVFTVSWPVNRLYPVQQYSLKTRVQVQ